MVTQVELQHLFTVLADLTRQMRDMEKAAAIEHQKAAHRYATITRELNHKLRALEDISQRILRQMKSPHLPQIQNSNNLWSAFIGSKWATNIAYALALGISNWIVIGSLNIQEVVKTAFGQ